jgi:Na+/H+ antiporter NhaB
MDIADLNDNTYVQTVATSSVNIALNAADIALQIAKPYVVIVNNGTNPVFAVAGIGSAPTAVYPTSSSVPLRGKVISGGSTVTYKISPATTHISFIAEAGSNKVAVSYGSGE